MIDLPGYGYLIRVDSLTLDQLEHVAAYASERDITWLEGMCDLALESGESYAVADVVANDPDLRDWMERTCTTR